MLLFWSGMPRDVAADTNGATFQGWLGAPACLAFGSDCDSGDLLTGRGTLGPEPNQPNTTFGECADGTSGTFHVEGSVDRIQLSSGSTAIIARGSLVQVDVTVFASSDYTNERLDVFETDNSVFPLSWNLVGSATPTAPGLQTLSLSFTPSTGTPAEHAVRASYRPSSLSSSACVSDPLADHDDLWFGADAPAGSHTLAVDVTSAGGQAGTIHVAELGGAAIGDCAVLADATAHCSYDLAENASIVLTPVPSGETSQMSGWTGACSGSDPCQLVMDQAYEAGAAFGPATHTLTLTVDSYAGGVGVVDLDIGQSCNGVIDQAPVCSFAVP